MTERVNWRGLFWWPTGTIALEIVLLAVLVLRGLSIIVFDGLTTQPMYGLALRLAPEWVWGAAPLAIGALWFCGVALGQVRERRWAAGLAAHYIVIWMTMLAIQVPGMQAAPMVALWLPLALAAAWVWLVLGWSHG